MTANPQDEATGLGGAAAAAGTPSLLALFLVCLKIGMFSFGGGLSGWLHQEFVRRHGWIEDDDFASILAIAQMLPGANVVNLVICMGDQLRGAAGAAVGVFGFLVGPFLAVIALSVGLRPAAGRGRARGRLTGGRLRRDRPAAGHLPARGAAGDCGSRPASSSSPSRRPASGSCAGR